MGSQYTRKAALILKRASLRTKARAEVDRCFKTLKDISEKYYIDTQLFLHHASFTELQIETLFDNMKKEFPMNYDSSMLDSPQDPSLQSFQVIHRKI